MAKAHSYKFCFGPWNISEGQDPYGPPVRQPQSFDWKLAQLKQHGFDAMMFHDDDAVPNLDGKSAKQIAKEARELKKRLDGLGLAAEMVAPRLWFHPNTIDGAYTSNDPKCRAYAIERSKICIDIAHELDTDVIVLWLAREGSYIRESKNARRAVDQLVVAFDAMLAYDKRIRLAIEPKPNEPMDHAYVPTIGHAIAMAYASNDPDRVGGREPVELRQVLLARQHELGRRERVRQLPRLLGDARERLQLIAITRRAFERELCDRLIEFRADRRGHLPVEGFEPRVERRHVVIGRHNRVELAVERAAEHGVRRERPGHPDAGFG